MLKLIVLLNLLLVVNLFPQSDFTISGELKQWHGVTITFNGPFTSENDSVNPFTDYRLNVLFTHSDTSYLVPGYYAADGNASETGASEGNKWRVIFTPDRTGEWKFTVSFRKGSFIAVDTTEFPGNPDVLDGITGSFIVSESDKSLPDFRSQGMLLYKGKRYLQFSGTKKYFIKGGSNSPENFLAYHEFDQTPPKHYFISHVNDWKENNPVWRTVKGKGIIGAVNYLSSKGVNSLYMLTFNVNGYGNDVWPYTKRTERLRFDCSKLDQWDIVFSYMQSKGILCHFVTQETENDHDLDGGDLGNQRKLYYRELIARFGYHPALVWNLGEEITNSIDQIESFAVFIRKIDPYDHFITMHNINFETFKPLLGLPFLDGPSMYIYNINNVSKEAGKFIYESEKSGRPWACFLDEIGPYDKATPPDIIDPEHNELRKKVLWTLLMTGGAGMEWYMGYDYPNNDLTLEDFRSRDHLWALTSYAVRFFNDLPLTQMNPADSLVNSGNLCLAKSPDTYAVYLPEGGNAFIDLPDTNYYRVKWFNPREGGDWLTGTKAFIKGNGKNMIGEPPYDADLDWAVVIEKSNVDNVDKVDPDYYLLQNFPNPFNIATEIIYYLPEKTNINISVYDVLGNLVQTIYQGTQASGKYHVEWNAGNLTSGIYLISLRTKYFTKSLKSVLLK